jgi:demethylmenaquinone methyltransferase/2-methoxy-6-polyprenyl-1,4-benzoquinol methylase
VVDKEAFVERLFTRIAPRYDAMNLVMTAGCWRLWQRAFERRCGVGPGDRVLDVGCGTAELSILMAARNGARVTGVDLSQGMLAVGREKVRRRGLEDRIDLVPGNALDLPFADRSFDAVASAFVMRNVADLDRALAEMRRVVRPGGRLAVMELSHPPSALVRAPFWLYFRTVPPLLGSWAREAYSWLPRSLKTFPDADGLARRLAAAGWSDVRYRRLTFGIVCLHTARRPG